MAYTDRLLGCRSCAKWLKDPKERNEKEDEANCYMYANHKSRPADSIPMVCICKWRLTVVLNLS